MNAALVLVLTALVTAVCVVLLFRLWKDYVARRDAEKFSTPPGEFDLSWASKEAQRQAAAETAKRMQAGTNVQPMDDGEPDASAAPAPFSPGEDVSDSWATKMGFVQLDTAITDHDALVGNQSSVQPTTEPILPTAL